MVIRGDGSDPAMVLCVGLPLRSVGELAERLREQAVVIAAPDIEGALALLSEDQSVEDAGREGAASSRDMRPAPEDPAPVPALRIVSAARQAYVRGVGLRLSTQEFDLLAALASDTDRVWTFEELTAQVWRTRYMGDREHVNSAVKRLRRRLPVQGGVRIVSVRGIGYRLALDHGEPEGTAPGGAPPPLI